MVRQSETVEDDLQWRDAILDGDVDAWHRFVRRYSSLIVETSVRWSNAGCRLPSGCSLRRGPGDSLQRFLKGDCSCDRAGTAYAFILEKLQEKLAFYRGDRGCRLDTWVRHLLIAGGRGTVGKGQDYGYRQLYADYVRSQEGRIRAPVDILRTGSLLEKIYLQVHYGKDDDEICESLQLTQHQLEAALEDIEERLRARGAEFYWRFWGHLWVPRETDSYTRLEANEAEETLDPPAPGLDPDVEWQASAIQRAIAGALDSLPVLTRHLLWLALDEGVSAPAIAAELRAQDLARWTPRQVYTEIDRALTEVGRRVSFRLTALEDVELGSRQMKSILEYWSVRRFLPRRDDGRQIRR